MARAASPHLTHFDVGPHEEACSALQDAVAALVARCPAGSLGQEPEQADAAMSIVRTQVAAVVAELDAVRGSQAKLAHGLRQAHRKAASLARQLRRETAAMGSDQRRRVKALEQQRHHAEARDIDLLRAYGGQQRSSTATSSSSSNRWHARNRGTRRRPSPLTLSVTTTPTDAGALFLPLSSARSVSSPIAFSARRPLSQRSARRPMSPQRSARRPLSPQRSARRSGTPSSSTPSVFSFMPSASTSARRHDSDDDDPLDRLLQEAGATHSRKRPSRHSAQRAALNAKLRDMAVTTTVVRAAAFRSALAAAAHR